MVLCRVGGEGPRGRGATAAFDKRSDSGLVWLSCALMGWKRGTVAGMDRLSERGTGLLVHKYFRNGHVKC